ncbi:hypothetical protein Egran_04222 [Elaphomyces granulatus]|uniref:Zinc finger GRF-type domain-containing protein n=1 Tax=Elaphomyces granulatus TaxID=519963 RepID=A0A232LV57_9EURO|nr:hypothetical protein Egran_04222 [Elaphomyces granulatus]
MAGVYTCQKQQSERCRFFLWEDDAKSREKVLSNTRSDPNKTPSKPSTTTGLLTPETGSSRRTPLRWTGVEATPSKRRKTDMAFENDDIFDSLDVASEVFSGPLRQPNFNPQTRGQIKTSPRKRTRAEMEDETSALRLNTSSQTLGASIGTSSQPSRNSSQAENSPFGYPGLPTFRTPSSSNEAMFTPTQNSRYSSQNSLPEFPTTPTPIRHNDALTTNEAPEISSLAAEALVLLQFHDVELPSSARDGLVTLLDKLDVKIKGISRGREIVRIALKTKEDHIRELNDRIEALEMEKEMHKAVIAGLKISNGRL